ncbi:MAG: chorismate synthase [Treponema sp.]|nr:chorismate synthase [Treponema sp.]
MPGNSFGTIFRVTTFGESHGLAVGCVIDGCPAGISLSTDDIAGELKKRRPGPMAGPVSSARFEEDEPEILSGLYEGTTLGTPIAIIIRNNDQHSNDYDELKDLYRPGHADWSWEAKYGLRDHRGGGRSSGRETAGRVAAGAVAKVFLRSLGVTVRAWAAAIAGIEVPGPGEEGFDLDEAEQNPFCVPCKKGAEQIAAKLKEIRAGRSGLPGGDSAGGIASCRISGLPAGLGEPVFDKFGALLGHAILSIGACKGIEFGSGFASAASRGSSNNDAPILPPDTRGSTGNTFRTNNSGGMLGGISNGMDVFFRAAFKPVASIAADQTTIDLKGDTQHISVQGRHDLCIVPRAAPVVEAMAALVTADLLLLQRCARGVSLQL